MRRGRIRTSARTILLAATLILLTSLSWDTRASQGRRNTETSPNLILITIDTLRADYVGAYGASKAATPWLDRLASEGTLFDLAYCQVPLTPPSHASILTGTYPATHGLRDFTSVRIRPEVPTLASMLKEQGYQTAAFVSAFVLDESWGLGKGFDTYFDDFQPQQFEETNPGNVQRSATETIDRVLPWVEKARSPFFLWVHLFDPHHDYNPPEPFKSRYRSDPYAGEVAYADSEIGRLLTALRDRKLYQNSLIVATSDHGEGLGEHGEREHGFFLYEESIRIPLIFKLPSSFEKPSARVPVIAQSVDILPTALQVLRIPRRPSWRIEGRGLLSEMLGKKSQPAAAYAETLYPQKTYGWSPLFVYREGNFKFIDAPRPELYDLSTDPEEAENLYGKRSALANQLQQKLRGLESSFSSAKAVDTAGVDSDRLERLSALGYVAVDQPVALRASGLPDPKDKIGIYNKILEGLEATEAGNLQLANAILGQVAESEPEMFVVHHTIGMNLVRLNESKAALQAFERARALNPGFASIDIGMAQALAQMGELNQAITILERVSRENPAQIAARRQLALLLSRRGQPQRAASIYNEILEKRPGDSKALEFLGIARVESRQYAEGLQSLDSAISAGNDNALVRNFRGIALANLGQPAEAVRSYRKALEMNPRYDPARLNLALTLLKQGQQAEARKEFDQLCRSNAKLCSQYRNHFETP